VNLHIVTHFGYLTSTYLMYFKLPEDRYDFISLEGVNSKNISPY